MNIITAEFKKLFEIAIDQIISDTGLTTKCTLYFDSSNNMLCNNCIIDHISGRSSNRYNNTGPSPFGNGSVCPVCVGFWYKNITKQEDIYLALLLDSKSWVNWGSINVKIPNLAAQTLSDISTQNSIMSCTYMTLYNQQSRYQKASHPELLGFSNKKYILTNWTKI